MNSDSDNLVTIILGVAVVAFVIELTTKTINFVQKFYYAHKLEIFIGAISLVILVVVAVNAKLYLKFYKKREEQKILASKEVDRQMLIEKKRSETLAQEKLNLDIDYKLKEIPIQLPKPKKRSLAARAAKED